MLIFLQIITLFGGVALCRLSYLAKTKYNDTVGSFLLGLIGFCLIVLVTWMAWVYVASLKP